MNVRALVNFGTEEGATCWRNGCQGVICEHAVENCSCHISPPCSACTKPREYCPVCDWCAEDDHETFNDTVFKYGQGGVRGILGNASILSMTPRPLDPRKLDWHSRSHSGCSMIKEGVYPESMTRAEVEAQVKGTFGGRFEHFGVGKFKYIAYTD